MRVDPPLGEIVRRITYFAAILVIASVAACSSAPRAQQPGFVSEACDGMSRVAVEDQAAAFATGSLTEEQACQVVKSEEAFSDFTERTRYDHSSVYVHATFDGDALQSSKVWVRPGGQAQVGQPPVGDIVEIDALTLDERHSKARKIRSAVGKATRLRASVVIDPLTERLEVHVITPDDMSTVDVPEGMTQVASALELVGESRAAASVRQGLKTLNGDTSLDSESVSVSFGPTRIRAVPDANADRS